ncbi:E3 ubiquitin-protein ligase SIAH1B-like [Periplaneta americana]|uniref:E3 ubiquitin-protein ligase SIAH1B-like n=1 Tax=Periplaneta americana TaxID=6978 RepID=UPI0037E983CA
MESSEALDVINLLECPSCHKMMTPPIFMCEKRHNVCARCKGDMTMCPACQNPFTDERNGLAERLAEQLPYACPNVDKGCKEKLLLRKMAAHEVVCPQRLYHCVPCRPRCRWRGRRFQILEHMKDEHKELVWVKSYNSLVYENFDIKTDYTCTHILSCLKEIFWCHSRRDANKGRLFEAIQYIGKKGKAECFEYEFEFYCKGNNRTAVFRNKVQDEENDVEKIYESGDCLVLDLSVLKYFVNEKKQLFYNLKLERIRYKN